MVTQLVELRRRAELYLRRDGWIAEDEQFFVEQNALVVRDAEEYYQQMYRGSVSSWNLRDRHMAFTLDALRDHLDRQFGHTKIVVWEHNSHVGDARATAMGARGRAQRRPARTSTLRTWSTFLLGLTTYAGRGHRGRRLGRRRPAAARPPGAGPHSHERLLHDVGLPAFWFDTDSEASRAAFGEPRLERAIGVVYRPETERQSHYRTPAERPVRRGAPHRPHERPRASRTHRVVATRRTAGDLSHRLVSTKPGRAVTNVEEERMIPETLVVPLDGSKFAESAVPVATALASRSGGRVVLTTTVMYEDGNTEAARHYLRGVAAATAGPDPEIAVLDERDPVATIRHLVEQRAGSMVCATTHGRGGLRWAVLGSVAEELLRSSPDPVLLVGPRCAANWDPDKGHVVVCHDGSDATRLVLDDACDFAAALGQEEVWVATVIHSLDVEGAERPEPIFDDVEGAVAARGLKAHAVLCRSSYPAGALADAANDLPASLLVMPTHGRTGLARVLVGSCTMGVLGLAPCPVLVRSGTSGPTNERSEGTS